jgi:RNA ligase (TIGR02306 family)
MSTLEVKICKIDEIKIHPNADLLEIAIIGGWDVIIKKGMFYVGDLVVFIPPDAILPEKLHKLLNITQYCAELPKNHPLNPTGHRRVKAARLRGVASFGTICTIADLFKYTEHDGFAWVPYELDEGKDVTTFLDITKWEPPTKMLSGESEKEISNFHKYTDIENWRKYPNVFHDGESIVLTEKIHGSNCRLGYMIDDIDGQLRLMAGSHRNRRKEGMSVYWQPFDWYPQLKEMMYSLYEKNDHRPIVVFGEIFGPGVQDLTYNLDKKDFRVFDISVAGQYLSFAHKKQWCESYNIKMVPVIYVGPYSREIITQYTDGTAFSVSENAKFKGREGVVITSYTEDTNPAIGRRILKSVSADYLARKGAIDNE